MPTTAQSVAYAAGSPANPNRLVVGIASIDARTALRRGSDAAPHRSLRRGIRFSSATRHCDTGFKRIPDAQDASTFVTLD
ncbi:hypothetical protein A33K_15311 [Burkholderia humptydooensis MSMB43]|uniref:Uncharacterized protein n=1 Tax=Burkholderia humptydooensis MSMB43 TaxID=441157 RepID=A0ABN0G545_9BURK|nr:hypothetical protein A33K_15311 [Burkholderia humptydooensis MSMB43]